MAQEKNINDLIKASEMDNAQEDTQKEPAYKDVIKEFEQKRTEEAKDKSTGEQENTGELTTPEAQGAQVYGDKKEEGEEGGDGKETSVVPQDQLAILKRKKEKPAEVKNPAENIGSLLQGKGKEAEGQEDDRLAKYGAKGEDIAQAKAEAETKSMHGGGGKIHQEGGKRDRKAEKMQRAEEGDMSQKKTKGGAMQKVTKKVVGEGKKGAMNFVARVILGPQHPVMLVGLMKDIGKKIFHRNT